MKHLIFSLATAFFLMVVSVHAQEHNTPSLAKNGGFSLTQNYLHSNEEPAAPQYSREDRRMRGMPVGDNTLTGSPVNLVVVNGYVCYGFGFTYEHLFGPDQIVGIQVPVHFAFGINDWDHADDGHFFYTAPGLQVHVAGANRKFDYALGPSVVLGNLRERIYNNGPTHVRNTFTSGIMLDNNLNFQRRHFLFGIHIGMGATFPNNVYDSRFCMQFGFRFGGRF